MQYVLIVVAAIAAFITIQKAHQTRVANGTAWTVKGRPHLLQRFQRPPPPPLPVRVVPVGTVTVKKVTTTTVTTTTTVIPLKK